MTINYPIKKTAIKQEQFAKRGMNLEADLNATNEYYVASGKAIIHKKPTPVKVVHVSYPSRQAAEITKAYFTTPSTTDYNGIYQGYYIDFEAKETTNLTSFPLQNIHPHQVEHLLSVRAMGGIAFVIIAMTRLEALYVLMADELKLFYERQQQGGRKSIAVAELKESAYRLEYRIQPRLDYLTVIDRWLLANQNTVGNGSTTPTPR
jgi:recombination protein U